MRDQIEPTGVRGRVRGLCLALALASLSFIGTWLNMFGRGAILTDLYTEQSQTIFYGCRLISLVVIVLTYRIVRHSLSQMSTLGGALISVGTVTCIIAAQGQDAFAGVMGLVGHALCGLGYLPCLIPIYVELAKAFDLRGALGVTLLALLAKRQLPALIVGASEEVRIWALAGILVLLMCCLLGFWRTRQAFQADRREEVLSLASSKARYALVLEIVGGITLFVFGSVSGVGLAGEAQSEATHGVMLLPTGKLIALAVCAVFGYLLIVRRSGRPLSARFTPAFVLLALSTALATIIANSHDFLTTHVASAVLVGIYDFNQFLNWALLVSIVHVGGASVVYLAIVSMATYDLLATIVGTLSVNPFTPHGANVVVIFGLVVIVLVAVAAPSLTSRGLGSSGMAQDAEGDGAKGGPFGEDGQAVSPHSDTASPSGEARLSEADRETSARLQAAIEQRCKHLARRFGLTARETDVFHLLCQGHSRAHICEALCMSEGTVKTHIAHIYEKTGVNTHQALAQIVFASGARTDAGA